MPDSDLQSISGIGNTTERKLVDAGIGSVNELANATVEDLEDLGIRQPQTILDRAQRQGAEFQSALDVHEDQQDATFVPTGMDAVDEMLGGGVQGGFLIGISGESNTGKTQFALQCLTSAVEYSEGNAVYIETEPNRFQADRVTSLFRDLDEGGIRGKYKGGSKEEDNLEDNLEDSRPDGEGPVTNDIEDALQRIRLVEGYSSDEDTNNLDVQRNAYTAIRDNLGDEELSLIVVDSFTANFRLNVELSGRENLPQRNEEMARHLELLQALADEFDCPVLLTLQVQGNPERYGPSIDVWGPVLMDHAITHLLHLEHGTGDKKDLQLRGHPGRPDDEVSMLIPEDAPLRAQ